MRSTFRATNLSAPPPLRAGSTSRVLKLLEPSTRGVGHNSAVSSHRVDEARYADRGEYLGDPDRTAIPVAQLTSEDYLDQRRTIIRDEVANFAGTTR